MAILKLYHGTTEDKVPKIKKEGIISPMQDAQWYMLSDNFGSALFHCNASKENKAVVLEIELKVPDIDNDLLWKGYPVLYPEYNLDNSEISWFALNEKIAPEYIKKIHAIELDNYLEQKNKGFEDLEKYNKKTLLINNKSKNKLNIK